MKTLTQSIAAIALLGTLTLGMSMDIDAQLEAISTASEADRVELVNELKTELQSMTPEARQEVIGAVRAELGVQDGTGEGVGVQTRMRQRSQTANADGAQDMQAGERSGQRRADASIDTAAAALNGSAEESGRRMFGKR